MFFIGLLILLIVLYFVRRAYRYVKTKKIKRRIEKMTPIERVHEFDRLIEDGVVLLIKNKREKQWTEYAKTRELLMLLRESRAQEIKNLEKN